MTYLQLRRFALTLFLPLATLICAAAPARAQIDHYRGLTYNSSAVGVTRGQLARLNVFFHDELPPGPCAEGSVCTPPGSYRMSLNFCNEGGDVVATRELTLVRDKGAVLVYAPSSVRTDGRAGVRARVFVEPDASGYAPQLVVTTEVLDPTTGQTFIINPGTRAGFNPQPEPPGDSHFGLFNIVRGQTARVNVSNVGAASSDLPPGPCRADVVFYDGTGRVVGSETLWLAGGQTGMSDFVTTNMPAGFQGRIRASVHVESLDGRSIPVVATSVELFAADTGRSALFYPGTLTGQR